jgi:hypothetical protein
MFEYIIPFLIHIYIPTVFNLTTFLPSASTHILYKSDYYQIPK